MQVVPSPGGGNDTLEGGAGDDTLQGCNGADMFVFMPGHHGVDLIKDYSRTQADRMDVRSFQFQNFQAIQIADNSVGWAEVTLSANVKVVLAGIATASLTAADFML